MSSFLKLTELGQISICGRQAFFCSVNEDLAEYLSSLFLSLLCVKLGVPSFTEGPHGNYHNKGLCAHSLLWEGQPWQEFQTFLSFSSFYPSRLFQTWGLHPPSTLLASTPQPTRGETEKESRAESTHSQSLTVNKQGCSCCLPHRRFLFCCWEVFYELFLGRALNPNITHTCAPMTQIGDESHSAVTLIYEWHIWASFFGRSRRVLRGQLNKIEIKAMGVREGHTHLPGKSMSLIWLCVKRAVA